MPLSALLRRTALRAGLGAAALPRRTGFLAAAFMLSTFVAVAATVTAISATLDGSNVRVDWEVNTETDVTGFDLARKSAFEPSYILLSTIAPTGQRRYSYTDHNVYRGGAGSGPFTYRLTVHAAASEQSYTATLAQTPSAVQRSWGTIKSMFR